MKETYKNLSENLTNDFPYETTTLMKHLKCSRQDVEIYEDLCGDYFILVKGRYWGYINDVDYLMEDRDD